MSTVDLNKRKRAVKISKAINSIEGVPVSEKTENVFSQWADGKITGDKCIRSVRAIPEQRL